MSPPTEQLIRDYLNRLSVAARGQLAPEDRRALVSRTRDFIERKTGFAGPPTAVEVARLLSGLGDPAGLVDQERRRLAAIRGELPDPAASRSRITKVLRRDSGQARRASWHWPVQEASRADLRRTLFDTSPATAGGAAQGPARNGAEAAGATAADTSRADDRPVGGAATPAEAGSEPAAPAQAPAREQNWFSRLATPRPSFVSDADIEPADTLSPADASEPAQTAEPAETSEPVPAGPARPRWPSVVARGAVNGTTTQHAAASSRASAADVDVADNASAWQLTAVRNSVALARRARRLASAILSWSRPRPLEATAVLLLGPGAVIYPPVWLLGVIVALASRTWDYRDKWLGLAAPLLLTVIGTAAGVAAGGRFSFAAGLHEGWMFGFVISRVAAALGAGYLAWRTAHARRPPAVPPWNKPRKVG